MTDRKLLEAAAKAAGIVIDKSPYNGGGHRNDGFTVMGNAVLDWHNGITWNPLTDDGDALRLAVKLRIRFWIEGGGEAERMQKWAVADHPGGAEHFAQVVDKDENEAARRAIVRAAAAIGTSA
jgi:hypothetical protein